MCHLSHLSWSVLLLSDDNVSSSLVDWLLTHANTLSRQIAQLVSKNAHCYNEIILYEIVLLYYH